MELCGAVCRLVERPYRAVWSCKDPCEAMWNHLETCGAVWSRMEPFGNMWSRVEPCCGMWSCVERLGATYIVLTLSLRTDNDSAVIHSDTISVPGGEKDAGNMGMEMGKKDMLQLINCLANQNIF